MIKSFASKETEKLFAGIASRSFPFDIQRRALNKLRLLHAAKSVAELLNPPSNRFHALKGDREGQYSISINKQSRICFEWADGAENVEIVDYH